MDVPPYGVCDFDGRSTGDDASFMLSIFLPCMARALFNWPNEDTDLLDVLLSGRGGTGGLPMWANSERADFLLTSRQFIANI